MSCAVLQHAFNFTSPRHLDANCHTAKSEADFSPATKYTISSFSTYDGYSIKCVPYSLSCYVQSVLVCHNHIVKCLLQLSVVQKLSLVNMCGLDVPHHFLVVLHHLCSHCALYFLILMFLQLRFITSLFILLK